MREAHHARSAQIASQIADTLDLRDDDAVVRHPGPVFLEARAVALRPRQAHTPRAVGRVAHRVRRRPQDRPRSSRSRPRP